jgi:isoquinoline 1-oxidoreductase beta subunit
LSTKKSSKMETEAISRRSFIRVSGLAGTALCLGFYYSASAKEERLMHAADAEKSGIQINAWINIDTEGKVTLTDHRAEMGQGSYQSVPQIIAEELEVDMKDINIIFGQGDNKKYGSQITGGSSTIRGSYKNLLKLSASAREMLIAAAAAKWSVPATECYAESGSVIHKVSGKKFHYGELVTDASKLEAPKSVKLKKVSDYKLIRKPLNRLDTSLKTNGKAIFGLDKKLPRYGRKKDPRCTKSF